MSETNVAFSLLSALRQRTKVDDKVVHPPAQVPSASHVTVYTLSGFYEYVEHVVFPRLTFDRKLHLFGWLQVGRKPCPPPGPPPACSRIALL